MVPDDHSHGDQEEPICTHSVSLFQGGHGLTMRAPPHSVGLWVPPCRCTLQPDTSILGALHFNNGFRAQAWGERPGLDQGWIPGKRFDFTLEEVEATGELFIGIRMGRLR